MTTASSNTKCTCAVPSLQAVRGQPWSLKTENETPLSVTRVLLPGVASVPPQAPAARRVGAGALTRAAPSSALLFLFLLHYLDCFAIGIKKRV